MTNVVLCLGVAILVGLLMTRICKPLGLPAVTGYLVAGILIGPYCLGQLGIEGLGFVSLHYVESLSVICDVALGFIAFTIGNEFRVSQVKAIGKQAAIVSTSAAVLATILVGGGLVGLHFIMPDVVSIPTALIMGAIAAATAPAATLMVIKQYKAKGPVTTILLPVVALDDAIGLVIFAVCFGAAKAVATGHLNVLSLVLEPIIEIVASLLVGSLLGAALAFVERFFHSRSKRLSLTVAFVLLGVAISTLKFNIGTVHVGFSSLLLCMMMGTVFCNLCDFSEELMDRLDRWTGPLFALFFVISGAELELSIFTKWTVVLVGVAYIVLRCLGKYFGSYFSAKLTKCDENITKYLGITLFPQAGVALGMMSVVAASTEFHGTEEVEIIRNLTLFSVMIYELVGPMMTKISLTKAGEINPEHRKSSRGVMHK
ncbi:MAG: cation:proton antiporter [Clostridia bacterium]|nr:cation:proton antiporter [Clostridia bacterium]